MIWVYLLGIAACLYRLGVLTSEWLHSTHDYDEGGPP